MGKITKKQQVEIDFLCEEFGGKQEDAEEFISWTVLGKNKGTIRSDNTLFQAKRRFDITLKMWREDLGKTLFKFELLEDFKQPYIRKIIEKL